MTLAGVRAALEAAVASLGYPIAWTGVPYTPVTGQAFLRVSVSMIEPGPHVNLAGDGFAQRGLLRVVIHTPTGKGPAQGDAIAQAIRAKFPVGSVFGSAVRILWPPTVSGETQDGGWLLKTVTVSIQAPMEV